MRTRPLVATLAVLAFAVLAAGCENPFTPARPELPGGSQTVRVDFSDPDSTLATIARAFSIRGTSGQQAYFDALADSTAAGVFAFYAFHPTNVVDAWHSETNGTPPTPWDKEYEKRFFNFLSGIDNGDYAFTFGPDLTSGNDEDLGPDLKKLHRHYELVSQTEVLSRRIAVGYADLYLQRVNSAWRLYRWEDRLDNAYGLHPTIPDEVCMGRRRLDSTSGS